MCDTIIGVDISKDWLDVYRSSDEATLRINNSKAGFRELLNWLKSTPLKQIVFEATGAYHQAFEEMLQVSDFPYAKINPKQARHFANATGTLAKTDRVDARLLAHFGRAIRPEQTPAKSKTLRSLNELVLARRALVKDRTAIKNRNHTLSCALLKRQAARRLKQIATDLQAIDATCRALIAMDQTLRRRFILLQSVTGLGAVTIYILLAQMPELGTMNKRQVAALAGLAPITRQSGNWSGKSYIQGGRKIIRDAMYMPALVAIRHNAVFRQKYDSLITAGKPAKVAITAVMRKLITTINAMLKHDKKFRENTA